MSNTERSSFIASLKKDASKLKAAASKKASTGILDDVALIEALDLSEDKKTFRCRLSKVNYGFDKNKNKFFTFNYVIIEGKHKGTPIGVDFFGLPKDDAEKMEKSYERIMANFQRLGYDTTAWAAASIPDKCLDTADALTEASPGVLLSLNVWGKELDRVGTNILSTFDASDVAETRKAKAESSDEEESTEEEESEEEATEVAPPEDGSTWDEWVGYQASLALEDGDSVMVTTTAYEDGIFTVTDDDANEYQCSPSDLTF
jgi:hypothetical protein